MRHGVKARLTSWLGVCSEALRVDDATAAAAGFRCSGKLALLTCRKEAAGSREELSIEDPETTTDVTLHTDA